MRFTGNVEPCFIQPTAVAINESLLNQSITSSKSNWLDHYFLLTESPLTLLLRIKNIWTFNILRLYIVENYVLALVVGYTTSKVYDWFLTAVVTNVGDGATYLLPVTDGYVIGSSIKSIPIVGKDVTLLI
ncbi:hypothetical protein CXB51_026558 [Gossypium anomalum]|uniref:Uncharacterized protein n=1 Tax=Gossypium anomalum TaxID=47600 RepID=A0A8J5YE76_9ROSI|nr:hypothetical protein CXB51_026558 [Gossypium anomalum]